MHIHILGICGTFMGGIAAIARQSGHTVTGCDENIYPPMSTQLKQLGITLHKDFDDQQIELFNPDVFIVGNVMTRGMAIIERLLTEKRPLISGPQWLYEQVLHKHTVIAVAGTHGKTTTSSLITWILEDNHLQPGFLIGGVPQNFTVSARLGESPLFVIEADEYDTAFFDKRSKFMHYHPDILVLNNLEFDHADIFDSLADIKRQFHHLLKIIPENGQLIINHTDNNLGKVIEKGSWSKLTYFGNPQSDWQIIPKNVTHFEIAHKDIHYAAMSVLPGIHNQMNVLAAIIASHKAGVKIEDAISSAASFQPPKRRLELKFQDGSLCIFDDFAHHPTAIAETIKAMKSTKKLVIVFEPRSNSMQSGAHSKGLTHSFTLADEVIIYQNDHSQSDFSFLTEIYPLKLKIFTKIEKIIEHLTQTVVENTDVVFMSNGGFDNIINKFINKLKN